ncbi:type IV secretion system protein VirB3 [Variovorax ginsengisoli]|uniref:Type IV secretion system protein VirB3 n=1 Tax=Variovorax ginsengisoli TaxID=363844 RepID=A0ABT9SDJ3_9BURK|nr:VirB3 family type IV secretion system protein [Variovorax ginsengisoli]MDP9902414.1 type IV secretion system protein VirB3 [Variovorax ginsengisoli]
MRDRIFKGATRPAMMWGVPIIPFILVAGAYILVAVWTLIFFGLVASLSVAVMAVFTVFVLRFITSQDDQRLNQMLLYIKSRPFRRNKAFWGAHSMSPTVYKRRGGQ